ncbi:alanyl-tRNA editing protein Aarsd1-A isoform X2 [Anopheles bellator]|uniref:alanyl-tRNA editing protein Aarsd1-A isoform X2 n=1 Tax=Anopheles bellator TaxID=139047 RepID=UPI0026484BCF|nr:alanyl-tRNA editing protein Aarsd1-A isoform X2 [Anopheles bellator]
MVFKCQEDSFLREFKTKVVLCEKSKGGYNVVFEDTVLFPEGGGQPCDYGQVGDQEVKSVIRKGSQAVHFIESNAETAPFTAGEEVLQRVDWGRRFDHMTQHSGQHLITAIFDRDLKSEQLETVEKICNELIADCTPVRVKVYEADDPALKSDVTRATRGLPDDVAGPLRVVTIENVESNMCCGTHVRNLGQLQAIKLLGVDKAKNKCLVHFLVGTRVLRKLTDCYSREVQLNGLLNGGPASHIDLVKKLQSTVRSTQRITKKLSNELATVEAEKLSQLPEPPKYFMQHRCDGPDSDFINIFLRTAKLPECFVFLTNGETDNTGKGQIVLQGKPEDIAELGPKICTILEGKGNGKGTRFNAKVNKLKNLPLCEKLVSDYFSLIGNGVNVEN